MMPKEQEKPAHVGFLCDKYVAFVRQGDDPEAMFGGMFDSAHHAQRLCDMLNDLPVPYDEGTAYQQSNKLNGYRIASTLKLFCLQENLAWEDLGLDERQIRQVNKLLEEGLNGTNQTSSARNA